MLRALTLILALGAAAPALAQEVGATPPAYPPGAPSAQSPAGPALYPPAGARWSADPEMRKLRRQMRQACATEIETYCTSAQGPSDAMAEGSSDGAAPPPQRAGRGHGVGRCLMMHQATLRPDCLAALQQMRDRRAADRANGENAAPPSQGAPSMGYGPG